MTADALPALALFALVTSVTPGPNNLMLLASGLNFGFRRTVPHLLGISVGFTVMVALVGLGLAGLFRAVPALSGVLTVASVAYLVVLAARLAATRPASGEDAGQDAGGDRRGARPLGFVGAAAFQWVNPKAWTMALTACAAYAPDASPAGVATVAAVFGIVNLPSVGLWAVAGVRLRRVLRSARVALAFNRVAALLLLLSLLPVLTPLLP